VNKTEPGSEWDGIIDFHVKGETDEWCEKVVEDWKKTRPSDWEVQKTLEEEPFSFTVAKDVTNTVGVKSKGGPSKPLSTANRENEQPSLPLPSSRDEFTLPAPPLSPSKRRKTENHYSDDGECSSPSKKRASRDLAEPVEFEGRGLLFADTTNTKPAAYDEFDVPPSKSRKPLSTRPGADGLLTGLKLKSKTRVEVVITSGAKLQARKANGAATKRVNSSVRSVKTRRTRVAIS